MVTADELGVAVRKAQGLSHSQDRACQLLPISISCKGLVCMQSTPEKAALPRALMLMTDPLTKEATPYEANIPPKSSDHKRKVYAER